MKRHDILYGRIAYSLIIVLVYLIGRSIPIPWDAAVSEQSAEGLSALFDGILGGSAGLTLFSLGLTPWIVATIIAQALNPLIRKYTSDEASVRGWLTAFLTLILAAVLAVIQVQEAELVFTQGLPGLLQKGTAVILLTAGSFCIVWLARRNEDWGIGGQRLLIAINLTDTLWSSVNSFRKENTFSLLGKSGSVSVIVLLSILLVVIAVTVFFQVKEYRDPVHRLMIDSCYASEDYLAIRYNPAGTMPVMYVMALFSMLSSLASAYAAALPTGISDPLLRALNLSSIPGAVLFLLLFRVMTGVAAAFTIDPVKTADDLKRSGGYIERVHPGKDTEKFLRKKIRHASNLSSVAMGLIIVLPYAYGLIAAGTEEIGNIAVSVILLTGILIELAQECTMYYFMEDYRPILGVESRVKSSGPDTPKTQKAKKAEKNVTPGAEGVETQKDSARSSVPAETEKGAPSDSAEDTAEALESWAYYFIPTWEEDAALFDFGVRAEASGGRDAGQEKQIIVPSIPVYDDIVHQMSMFRGAGEDAEMIALAYLPQLRYFLHRYRLEDIQCWSIYDDLQEIDPKRQVKILRWQDLDWKKLGLEGEPCDLKWLPDSGVMRGFDEGRKVFDVHFTTYGTVYYVDHYGEKSDELQVDRRSIFDDRGFLSSSIEFKSQSTAVENGKDSEPAEDSETPATKAKKAPERLVVTAVQRFYNQDEQEKFHIDFPEGKVTLEREKKPDRSSTGKFEYDCVSELLEDHLNALLKKCHKRGVFFLAAQGEADHIVRRAEYYAQGDRKVVLSFYDGRDAQLEGKKPEEVPSPSSGSDSGTEGTETSAKAQAPADDWKGTAIKQYKHVASMIIVDTEAKKEYFEQFEYVDKEGRRSGTPVEDVYPCEMRSRTGRSGSMSKVVIFIPADKMFDEDVRGNAGYIMKHIEYMMKEDANIELWFGTKEGKEHLSEFDKKRRIWFGKYRKYRANNKVNIFQRKKREEDKEDKVTPAEEEMTRRSVACGEIRWRENNELIAMHQRDRVVSYRTEEELEDILEVARLVLDPRTTPDLRLQSEAVCFGIPQVVRASSRYVVNTENGFVCRTLAYIADGLRYYLDGLSNWNRAHERCAQMIRQYSGEARAQQVQRWKKLIEGVDAETVRQTERREDGDKALEILIGEKDVEIQDANYPGTSERALIQWQSGPYQADSCRQPELLPVPRSRKVDICIEWGEKFPGDYYIQADYLDRRGKVLSSERIIKRGDMSDESGEESSSDRSEVSGSGEKGEPKTGDDRLTLSVPQEADYWRIRLMHFGAAIARGVDDDQQ